MKMDKIFEVYRKEQVSDGMGGWDIKEVMIGNLKGFTTPVESEIIMKEYGIVSTSAMKIYTKNSLPSTDLTLRYADSEKTEFINYEILQYSDYKKYRLLLVQVI